MAFKKEQIFFAPGFPFAMYETNARQVMIHCHDCLEVNLIKKGCGHYLIENHTYGIRENDIFIINNSEHHMAVHEEELSMLVFVFSPEFVWNSPDVANQEYMRLLSDSHYSCPYYRNGDEYTVVRKQN